MVSLRLLAHRMADRAELGPAVEVHDLDDERVAVPAAARVAEPGRRPVLAMRQPLGVDHLKHRALLEQEGDVLVVLQNLHRMRRERSDPAKRHAAAGVVAVLRRVVVVPLRLSPRRERQRIGFAVVAGAVRVRDRPGDVLNARPRPDPAEVGLAVGQARRGRLHVHLDSRRLRICARAERDEETHRQQEGLHDRLLVWSGCRAIMADQQSCCPADQSSAHCAVCTVLNMYGLARGIHSAPVSTASTGESPS